MGTLGHGDRAQEPQFINNSPTFRVRHLGDRAGGDMGALGKGGKAHKHRDTGTLGMGTWGRRKQGCQQGNKTIWQLFFPFGTGETQVEIHSAQSRAVLFPSVRLSTTATTSVDPVLKSSRTPPVEHKRACATCQQRQQVPWTLSQRRQEHYKPPSHTPCWA